MHLLFALLCLVASATAEEPLALETQSPKSITNGEDCSLWKWLAVALVGALALVLIFLPIFMCLCCPWCVRGDGRRQGTRLGKEEDVGDDYYALLVQNNPNVKSISQYTKKGAKVAARKVDTKATPKKKKSEESTGSTYFKVGWNNDNLR